MHWIFTGIWLYLFAGVIGILVSCIPLIIMLPWAFEQDRRRKEYVKEWMRKYGGGK